MKYCSKCLYPETKPDLRFDDNGTCSACISYDQRQHTSWTERESQFRDICNRLKDKGRSNFHCVVPVSGGKDSHYQILKCKEYGLNPLAVCAVTDDFSRIGMDNLINISTLCDLVSVHTSKRVRRQINSYTLREVGDISWAEHVTIFTIPARVALNFNIPLIIWGENPQNEYGGPTEEAQKAIELDKRWLSEYGGLLGLRVTDLIDVSIASKEELLFYTYPEIKDRAIQGLWLGQFFPWDGAQNALTASRHGFKSNPFPVEGTGYHYENLDNLQTGIHDYFKYIKYGFGRATDMVSTHIRRGTITREAGKEIILEYDGQYPATYLGVSLDRILEPLGIGVSEFITIANRFTNHQLFEIVPNRPRPRPKFIEDLRRC